MKKDIKIVKQSTNVVISADKSTNINGMEKDDYNLYLRKNITKAYKKTERGKFQSINHEAKKIVEKLSIDDRVEKMQENEAFITIKNHKEGFSPTTYHVDC